MALAVLTGLTGCASTQVPAATPAPPSVKTTSVRVFGTIERPGETFTQRKPGAPCVPMPADEIRATVLWSINAGTQSLGGGRLSEGHVRADVNTQGNGPGPCTFGFDETVAMTPSGDVTLRFGALPPLALNRTDILTGPLKIQTAMSGRLSLQTGG